MGRFVHLFTLPRVTHQELVDKRGLGRMANHRQQIWQLLGTAGCSELITPSLHLTSL